MSQPPESEHQELRAALAKVPLEEPPAELVRRWHAKLAALPPPEARETGRTERRTRCRRFPGRFAGPTTALGAGLLASAAMACALLWLPSATEATSRTGVDAPGSLHLSHRQPPPSPSAEAESLLSDKRKQAACLRSVGADGADVLGSRPVLVHGKAGVLLALSTSEPGRFRALVVTPDCGPGTGRVLSDTTLGR